MGKFSHKIGYIPLVPEAPKCPDYHKNMGKPRDLGIPQWPENHKMVSDPMETYPIGLPKAPRT